MTWRRRRPFLRRSRVLAWLLVSMSALVPILVANLSLSFWTIPEEEASFDDFLLVHETRDARTNSTKQEPPPESHPHGGARNAHGQLGYKHDATHVHNHPLPFSSMKESCRDAPGLGLEGGPEGYAALSKISIQKEPNTTTKKLFCMVYTHSNHHDRIRAIAETWGPRCDGFMAASNETHLSIGAVDLSHAGKESYDNMWQKVRSMWSYVHEHYLQEYDYFHIGGDDMYVIPENLKHYIATLDDDRRPIYMGGPIAGLMGKPRNTYCGGGSGYTLNRAALHYFVRELLPTCHHNRTKSGEDFTMAFCFRFSKKRIRCRDTSDPPAYRYHAQDAHYQATWTWKDGKQNILQHFLKAYHGMDPQEGLDGISNSSISFHLKQVKPEKPDKTIGRMRRYHAILYGLCNNDTNGHR